MPPEQARGAKALTVAADVYSLGAILYELLTGRPPFRGVSQYDTLVQVQQQEPEPPRRVNPAVGRDLEAVCLKCLRKQPAGRYASAGDLADELERWLAGEAVSACPPTRAERLARWVRRNPARAALAVAMLIGVGSAAFIPQATAEPVPRGMLFAGFLTAFFAFMMLLGHSETKALEDRLRREGQVAVGPAAVPASPVGTVPRGDLLRALGRGLGTGRSSGSGRPRVWCVSRGWRSPWIRWQGAWTRTSLWPAAVVAVAVVAVLVGAATAVLTRVLIRPFGRVAWGWGWLVGGLAVVSGTPGVHQLLLSHDMWQFLLVVIAPAAAVYMDWWTRYMQRAARVTAAAGQITPATPASFGDGSRCLTWP